MNMNTTSSNRSLKILHIILALTPTNGQYNEHCLPLKDQREITICTYFKSIWGIRPPENIRLYEGDDTLPGFFRALRAALADQEYDVIHVHTPHAGVLVPLILMFSGLYRKLKPSTVHTVQNSFQNFKLRHKLMFIPGLALFQNLVFCSKASYESFPAFYKWLSGGRVRIVQNTVDLERIDQVLNGMDVLRDNHFTVATVGLIKMKNPFTMLAAFHQAGLEAGKLVYMGEGHLRGSLSQEIARLGLQEQVVLTGMIERDRVFEQFGQADLFVSTSWGEGLPVAVLEAMACRSPVVLSDIPPHREIAEGADFIPLVKPGDAGGFAREIKKFSEMPLAERLEIGQKCRMIVEDRFSLAMMHSRYRDLYGQIAGFQFA